MSGDRWSPPRASMLACEPARHAFALRYEDVCQDGRLTMLAMPQALGEVFWRKVFVHSGLEEGLLRERAVPILTRLCTEGGEGPLAVQRPVVGEGAYRLAHSKNAAGEVDRLLLEVWIDLFAPRATTVGPAPPSEGEEIAVGRLYAEHVFTRLFAPPSERKVTRFGLEGLPPVLTTPVPEAERRWVEPHQALEIPAGATVLAPLRLAPYAMVLGLDDTDPNQHVNSLVYPRLFQRAALQRLDALGRQGPFLARRQDTAFRKPLFAGQRIAVATQVYEIKNQIVVSGCFLDASNGLDDARMLLSRGAGLETAYAYARVAYEASASVQ